MDTLPSGLEDRIAKYKTLSDENNVRRGLADAITAVSYGIVVGGAVEAASGMTLGQIISSRTVMSMVNAVAGAPYGWFRDRMFYYTGVTLESSAFKKARVDLLSTFYFWGGVYLFNVSQVCDDHATMWRSWLSMMSLIPVIGPTYGWYMDKVRSWSGRACRRQE